MTNKLDNKAAFDNDAAFNQKVFVNMDLIPCPVCGHLCSRDALTCPKCGKPLAKKNKVIAAILIVQDVTPHQCGFRQMVKQPFLLQ